MARFANLSSFTRRSDPRKRSSDATATIHTPVEQLDLATVIKVSEAVSGEIVFEKTNRHDHAHSPRACRRRERSADSSSRRMDYRIEAEATTSSDQVTVVLRQASVTAADLPSSVFHYVLRTKEVVLLHDASGQNQFAADEYIRRTSRTVCALSPAAQTESAAWCAVPRKQSHTSTRSPLREWPSSSCLPQRRRSPWRTRVSIATSKIVKRRFGASWMPTFWES